MRDSLATKEHWDSMINYMNEEIEWSKSSTLDIITKKTEKGEDVSDVVKRGNMELRSYYMSLLNSLYSSGAPIDEIRKLFPSILETFVGAKESGYLDILWFASIGVMFDVPIEMMQELERLVPENNYNDYLLDFLFRSVDPSWEKKHNTFMFQVPYEFLSSVIEAKTKEESLRLLKEYLEIVWYKGHKKEDWYNSHKNMKASFYDGYWSYESGAIAKILKLDDAGWESMKYYPYDMVHYNG